MKKTYRLTGLDCANCAAKLETRIKKLAGVHDAAISFMTQKLTIEGEDDCFDEIMQQVAALCRRIEPDCTIHM